MANGKELKTENRKLKTVNRFRKEAPEVQAKRGMSRLNARS
jgi:hypothetical protein